MTNKKRRQLNNFDICEAVSAIDIIFIYQRFQELYNLLESLTDEMINLVFSYKIKPTKRQIKQFEEYLSICRSVYNYSHAERKDWLDSRKSLVDRCSIKNEYIIPADTPFPNYNKQAIALTEAKKRLLHLKLVNAQCLQGLE